MKKTLFGIAAVAAIVGMVVIGTSLEAVGPKLTKPYKMITSDDYKAATHVASQAGAAGVALNYATGFEVGEGFTARDGTCLQDPCPGDPGTGTGYTGECGFIGDGNQGSGPYPDPWGVSGSNVNNIEGHVDTVSPFGGEHHLRLSQDPCDVIEEFGVDARVPANPPAVGVIGPSTYSAQIAIPTGLFGADVNWQPQSSSQLMLTSRLIFFYYGFFYILDDSGSGLAWVALPSKTWNTAYTDITVHHDPCAKFMCLDGGANAGGACPNGNIDCRNCSVSGDPCIGTFQCPEGETCEGGTCYGRIDYYYGGSLVYQGTTYAGTTSEQFLIYTDNYPGDADVDDLTIETGEPCPTVCGNLEVEPGEQCDGANEGNCPGRCIAPGETGPGGEAECTCIIEGKTCEEATPLLNGSNTVLTHGGWWTWTADTPAYALDMCDNLDYDSNMYVFTGTCDSLELLVFNDDCNIDDPVYGPGADPLAPCHPVGSPWQACTCIPTVPGQQYWVLTRVVVGADTAVNLNKREVCETIWEGGACCDGYGVCVDDILLADCSDKGDVWSAQKYCETVEPCDVTLGACCDHAPDLAGHCEDAMFAAECVGEKQEYFLGELCADITCEEVMGACCDGSWGTCSQTLRADCLDGRPNMVWTQATACSQVPCDPIPGACLDQFNPDPLSRDCLCTDNVLRADCQGDKLYWVKATSCAAELPNCAANFQAIPTVSEWGLVVLALLLLVGAKVYFGRREVVA